LGLWASLAFGGGSPTQSTLFVLARGQAGTLEIGMSIDTVRRVFGQDRVRLVKRRLEGQLEPAIEIRLAHSDSAPALVARMGQSPCSDRADEPPVVSVWGIDVYDPRFRTREGIGVGSTIGELRRVYRVRFNREEGHSVIVPSLMMTFGINGTSFADSVRATSVWVWFHPDSVRQRRCPNQ
jgi:hypothetical protein